MNEQEMAIRKDDDLHYSCLAAGTSQNIINEVVGVAQDIVGDWLKDNAPEEIYDLYESHICLQNTTLDPDDSMSGQTFIEYFADTTRLISKFGDVSIEFIPRKAVIPEIQSDPGVSNERR